MGTYDNTRKFNLMLNKLKFWFLTNTKVFNKTPIMKNISLIFH